MRSPKLRQIISFVFTCLCITKSLLIRIKVMGFKKLFKPFAICSYYFLRNYIFWIFDESCLVEIPRKLDLKVEDVGAFTA